MWEILATEHRAWDLLVPVLSGEADIGRLYDSWTDTRQNVREMRRRLEDADIEPLVGRWYEVYARSVKASSADHAYAHVRAFFPTGVRRLASTVTPKWLTERLYSYPGKRNTIRKVHSSLSSFLGFCVKPLGVFAANPMEDVERPGVEASPIRFYDLDAVERIVAAQPSPARRAFFALAYGSAIEVSVALNLTRGDVWDRNHEIRAAGTKAHSRDRVCRVADWAWPIVAEHMRNMLPTSRLWPVTWNRWTVSDWHRETVQSLGLEREYPLHCARDHWAVRAARAGTPVALIQAQLGHGSPMLTLSKYGRFLPSAADRATWEARASEQDAYLRMAK